MLPKKHLSGATKRKRKRQEEQFVQSQQGALDKFFSASSSVVRDDNYVSKLKLLMQIAIQIFQLPIEFFSLYL